MMPTVERMTARNSAGYNAPVGLAADPVVFTLVDGGLCVLLARRLEEPQRGTFALPGGFVGAEESPRDTAERKLREKTGVGSVHLEQLRTYASPDRDPRGWLPSIAYLALVPPESLPADGPSGREAS
jgi:8-oxo-dGTP diphosphatase